MTNKQRDNLLLRIAAHQYRMGEVLYELATSLIPTHMEVVSQLGTQNYSLSRSIEESQ